MIQSMKTSGILFLLLTGAACTPKNNGMDRSKTEPQTQTVPDTATPNTNNTNPSSVNPPADIGTSAPLTQPAPTSNCPDPMAPGYDPTKADPACPRPGSDIPPPATGTDPSRPTPP